MTHYPVRKCCRKLFGFTLNNNTQLAISKLSQNLKHYVDIQSNLLKKNSVVIEGYVDTISRVYSYNLVYIYSLSAQTFSREAVVGYTTIQ